MPSKSAVKRIDMSVAPEEWVDRYGDYLHAFALSRLRSENAAEEVLQDTFVAAIHSLQQFSGKGSQRGWLMRILRRKIVDHIRQRVKRRATVSLDREYDPTPLVFDEQGRWMKGAFPTISPDQIVESKELWQIIQSCLARIPQTQADVFVLSVFEEMETSRICEELEISAANVWTRLHRARLGLAKCVGAKWFPEEGNKA